MPHVIEPSAGGRPARRWPSSARPTRKTRWAARPGPCSSSIPGSRPIKAAIFPLVKRDGMPEKAEAIYRELKTQFNVFYDEKGAIGRRYRRQDEAGTPFCITVDSQTLADDTVTLRDRDSCRQWRVASRGHRSGPARPARRPARSPARRFLSQPRAFATVGRSPRSYGICPMCHRLNPASGRPSHEALHQPSHDHEHAVRS